MDCLYNFKKPDRLSEIVTTSEAIASKNGQKTFWVPKNSGH